MSLTKASYSMIAGAPANVLDFGATGDGVTDDAPAFTAALRSGAKHVIAPVPSVRYKFSTPINMTTAYAESTCCGITLEFLGSMDVNPTPNGSQPCIAAHTGHVLDMSGSRDCVIIGMNVEGSSTTKPSTMIFMARANGVNSSGGERNRFYNIRSSGYYTTTVVYMYGAEENTFFAPWISNSQAGKSNVYITANNTASLSSSFITIATGAQSSTTNTFYSGSYLSQGNSGSVNEACFFLEGCSDINIRDPFMYCPYGLAYIYASATNSSLDYVRVSGMRGEVGATVPLHGIYFGTSATPMIHSGWSIQDSRLNCGTGSGTGFMVYVDDNVTLSNAVVKNISNSIGNTISAKSLSNCELSTSSGLVIGRAGGTITQNVFTGWAVNRTLSGTSTFNIFNNTDTGNVTATSFTP